MKNIYYIIQGVFAIAIVALFILYFSDKKGMSFDARKNADSICLKLPIAYVNVDSLLRGYNYSQDMNEVFLRKAENTRANLNQKANSFQSEYVTFQKLVQNNGFLTQERMEQEANRLQSKQQKLQEESERVQVELAREQQKMNEQLRDTIISHLKEFNEAKKYQVIFTGETILYGEDYYNITAEVIEFLNEKYTSVSTSKPAKK
ncbi:MAG: OmpH family outer membrane protein [Dysgonamonadaceae bacterium]|jgi:outer membrane protein|nr:OmpH family outer membrane protein [Dysgonamonadaceae bacterium]